MPAADVVETPPTQPKPSLARRVLPIAIVALLGLAGFWIWREHFQTYHLATVKEGVLYRDGNRGMREFATTIKKIKPKTVVCLLDDAELADPAKPMFAQEMSYLQQHGVRVERIAVPLGGWPTSEQVKQFLDLVQKPENQPVLVHCAQGMRRTGMMAAAYQQSVLKMDDAKARDAVLMFGRKDTSRSVVDIRNFIDAYDETTGEVKANFSQPTTAEAGKVNWEKE
jgi:protein tyrosine/serine phosphatase